MPGLRDEITKTFLRLTGAAAQRRTGPDATITSSSDSAAKRHASAELGETVVHTDAREGQQVGAYRILRRLGAGGMGHVYLGVDTRLDRQVALKFLPPELTSDQELLHRLQQEARTASALNHPNILTIYEICEWNGEYFIASEFVDGTTLRTQMERGAIDVGTAIDISSQVASALMAAHSAGVIHRDLKPSNIMIRPDGYVKVIDFGLAKHFAGQGPDPTGSSFTRAGAVVGTIAYMSPEQARGDHVDQRTDLWSLGVILYEMIAHRRPFDGQTDSHVIVSILDHRVRPLPHGKSLPAGLAHLIDCALAKDPRKRYQTAGEMLADLQQVSQASRLGSKIRPVVAGRRTAFPAKLAAAALVIAVVLACAVWWWPMGGKERLLGPHWFRVESVRQLTFNGRTSLAALSPDGKYLAFVAGDPNGLATLYLKQVDSTTEAVKIGPKRITYAGLTFSADDEIFVVQKDERQVGQLFAVPIVGDSSSRILVNDIDGPVSFSPNGDHFAFVRYVREHRAGRDQTDSVVFIASRDGSEMRKLVSAENSTLAHRIAWSPKGDLIAAILYRDVAGGSDRPMLDLIDLNGRQSLQNLPNWRLPGQLSWTPDAKTLILTAVAQGDKDNHSQLMQVVAKSREARDITKDLAGYKSASMTVDGEQLAAVKLETKARLWISSTGDLTRGQSAPEEAQDHPTVSWYDGSHVMVNSQRSGFPNVWLFDSDTQTRAGLTSERCVEQGATSIPRSNGTGNSVVFSSNRGGRFHLWRFDPERNQYTQLTFGGNYEDTPSVTPDGRWVVYSSWISNDPHLRMVAADGGTSRQLRSESARDPQVSPDGKWIACSLLDPHTSKWEIAVFALDGSGAIRAIPEAQLPLRWAPEGNALTSVRTDSKGISNIWRIPLDGSAPRQLTHFDDETILNFAWSPKGDRLACVRATIGSDVALFSQRKSR